MTKLRDDIWKELLKDNTDDVGLTPDYNELYPQDRSKVTRFFDAISVDTNAVMGGLYNLTDNDPNSGFWEGVRKGVENSNPFGNVNQKYQHTFSDVLGNLGWKPNSITGKFLRGTVGLAGDILLSPSTYLTGGLSGILKGTGKKVATREGMRIVKELTPEAARASIIEDFARQGVEHIPTDVEVDDLVRRINDLQGIARKGDGVELGTKYMPFRKKLGIPLFSKTLVEDDTLRKIGDATVAPYINAFIDKARTSRKLNTMAPLVEAVKDNMPEVIKTLKFHDYVDGLKLDLDKKNQIMKDFVASKLDLDEVTQEKILNLLETTHTWKENSPFKETLTGQRVYNDIARQITKVNQKINSIKNGRKVVDSFNLGDDVTVVVDGVEKERGKITDVQELDGNVYYKIEGRKAYVSSNNLELNTFNPADEIAKLEAQKAKLMEGHYITKILPQWRELRQAMPESVLAEKKRLENEIAKAKAGEYKEIPVEPSKSLSEGIEDVLGIKTSDNNQSAVTEANRGQEKIKLSEKQPFDYRKRRIINFDESKRGQNVHMPYDVHITDDGRLINTESGEMYGVFKGNEMEDITLNQYVHDKPYQHMERDIKGKFIHNMYGLKEYGLKLSTNKEKFEFVNNLIESNPILRKEFENFQWNPKFIASANEVNKSAYAHNSSQLDEFIRAFYSGSYSDIMAIKHRLHGNYSVNKRIVDTMYGEYKALSKRGMDLENEIFQIEKQLKDNEAKIEELKKAKNVSIKPRSARWVKETDKRINDLEVQIGELNVRRSKNENVLTQEKYGGTSSDTDKHILHDDNKRIADEVKVLQDELNKLKKKKQENQGKVYLINKGIEGGLPKKEVENLKARLEVAKNELGDNRHKRARRMQKLEFLTNNPREAERIQEALNTGEQKVFDNFSEEEKAYKENMELAEEKRQKRSKKEYAGNLEEGVKPYIKNKPEVEIQTLDDLREALSKKYLNEMKEGLHGEENRVIADKFQGKILVPSDDVLLDQLAKEQFFKTYKELSESDNVMDNIKAEMILGSLPAEKERLIAKAKSMMSAGSKHGGTYDLLPRNIQKKIDFQVDLRDGDFTNNRLAQKLATRNFKRNWKDILNDTSDEGIKQQKLIKEAVNKHETAKQMLREKKVKEYQITNAITQEKNKIRDVVVENVVDHVKIKELEKQLADLITSYQNKVKEEGYRMVATKVVDEYKIQQIEQQIENLRSGKVGQDIDVKDLQTHQRRLENLEKAYTNEKDLQTYLSATKEGMKDYDAMRKESIVVKDSLDLDKSVDDVTKGIVKELREFHEEFFTEEVKHSRMQFEQKIREYVYHMLNPEHKEKMTEAMKDEINAIMEKKSPMFELGVDNKNALNRTIDKEGLKTVREINDFMKQKYGIDKFFLDQISDVFLARAVAHNKYMFDWEVGKRMMDNFGYKLNGLTDVDNVEDGFKVVINVNELRDYIKKNAYKNVDKKKPIGKLTDNTYQNMLSKDKQGVYVADKLLDQLGFTPEDLRKYFSPFIEIDREQARKIFAYAKEGINVHSVHDLVFRKANNLGAAQGKNYESVLLGFYDRFLNLYKLNVTAVIPGFHLRNKISNMFLNYLRIGAEATKPEMHKMAWDAVSYAGKHENIPGHFLLHNGEEMSVQHAWDLANDFGVVNNNMFRNELKNDVKIKGLFEKMGTDQKYWKFDPTNPKEFFAYKYGRDFGSFIESQDRFIHFVALLKEGKSPMEAAESVNKFMFDYTDLTDFENMYMKRIIPFYTWMRKNIPLQIENILSQPQRYRPIAQMIHEMEAQVDEKDKKVDKAFIADFAKDWVQLPFTVKNPIGMEEPVLWNPNLPYGDLNKIPDLSDPMGTLADILSQSSPMIKVPIEMATNKNYFFDSPIDRGKDVAMPGYLDPFGNMNGNPSKMNPRVKYLLDQIGSLNATGEFLEKKGADLGINALNTLGGVKLNSYDYDTYKKEIIQEWLEQKRTN